MRSRVIVTAVVVAAFAASALASWYDDYNEGLIAVRNGNWDAAAKKMSAAIAAKPKENNKERAYGTIFINYHPYYYRGVANLNLGRYEQAISDLETATGPGPENLGSIDMLLQMAKTRLQSTPAPVPEPTRPTPVPVAPTPVPVPVAPAIDPALRSRAQAALNEAKGRLQAAQQRKAGGTPQYQSALQHFTEANSKLAAAKTNDDLQAVIAGADNAIMIADSAQAPVTPTTTAVAAVVPTKPIAATSIVLADPARRVRQALESYFRGDFDEAARGFESLSAEMPRNGWIWAFLGASQYSRYAFEAEEQYRDEAIAAFRKAKQYRKWGKDGLPSKYFSRRIRRAFTETAG